MVGQTEADRLVDALIERGVLVEADSGTLSTTPTFEETRSIYYDTYMTVSEETFVNSVGDVFELERDITAERIEELGITREQFITYLALHSHIDDTPARPELAAMARIATEVGMNAVPPNVPHIDDHAAFLAEHGDVMLVVWSYPCSPCAEMKAELDEIRAAVPDGVEFVGIDGSEAPDLRREFNVEAAPTILLFRDGDHVESHRGYHSPDELAAVLNRVYG